MVDHFSLDTVIRVLREGWLVASVASHSQTQLQCCILDEKASLTKQVVHTQKSTSTPLPVKIHRKPVSNCAYPTKHEENVKIFFLTWLSTIFRWILNREHIFARDAEFIPDGGFAMKLGDAKDLVFLCYENQERRIS